MKRAMILAAIVAALAVPGASVASHCGPEGSPHDDFGNCDTERNDTVCSSGGTNIMLGRVYASEKGVQGCADDNGSFPLDGRVGASTTCRCVYFDGDRNNPGVTNGWGRIDATGYHCHRPGEQSYNSGEGRDVVACAPVQT